MFEPGWDGGPIEKEEPKDDSMDNDEGTADDSVIGGWDLTTVDKTIPIKISEVIKEIKKEENIEFFMYPVDDEEAPGYYEIIGNPMCISDLEKNTEKGMYSFVDGDKLFKRDADLIFSNCLEYNAPDSPITTWAKTLSETFEDIFDRKFGLLPDETAYRDGDAALGNGCEDEDDEDNKQRAGLLIIDEELDYIAEKISNSECMKNMLKIHTKMMKHHDSKIFMKAVDRNHHPEFYETYDNPFMHFHRLQHDEKKRAPKEHRAAMQRAIIEGTLVFLI